MIKYTVWARANHDVIIKNLSKELKKDYPWEGFKVSTETAIRRVCEKLGYCFIRKEGRDHYVIGL